MGVGEMGGKPWRRKFRLKPSGGVLRSQLFPEEVAISPESLKVFSLLFAPSFVSERTTTVRPEYSPNGERRC